MKLHADGQTALNTFTGYGEGYVAINNQRYTRSLVVLPLGPVVDWSPTRFEDLAADHFRPLAALDIEIVLLGTGSRLRFPRPEITRALVEARIGVEVMDVQAACRTYNILMSEERKVAAALLIE